jgi:glycosyltransferase involved in cell wall biosynthesis
LSPDVAVVGTVGRLEIRKGTDTLLEAAARLGSHGVERWQLVLVGDGPMRGELEALAARLGIAERTLFVGARTDVRETLAALDVFVLPSRTEGMSNALLEAMAMACPVVATAVGGTPEVVTEGASGLLVPSEQPDAMAAAVARALRSPDLAATLGDGARRRAEERFGSRAMVRRLEEVYASVVPNGNGSAAAGA